MAENSSFHALSSPGSSPHGVSGEGVLGLTARIVSAHIGNNKVAAAALPDLIQQVFHALNGFQTGTAGVAAPVLHTALAERPRPAVPASRSIFAEYLVCLEDGKKMKMLKRHLKTAYDMTPEQYRMKWGLDPSYPMVAPDYAKKRSSLAKAIGLGTRPREPRRT